jgi:MFS family permease
MRLSLLYLPMTLFWTAMQLQVLPERIEILAGTQKGLYLALVGSVGALAATFCMLVVGPLSDHTTHRCGRRYPWVVGGIAVGVAGILIFAVARALPLLLLGFVTARLGLAAAVAGYEAILPERVPPNYQSRASGWSECFDLIGQVAGVALLSLMVRGTLNSLFSLQLSASEEANLGVLLICLLCAAALLGLLTLNLPWIRGPVWPREAALPWHQALRRAFAWRPMDAPDFFRLYLSRSVLNMGTYTGVEFLRYFVAEALPMQNTDLSHEVMMIGLCVTGGGVFGALLGGWLGDFFPKRALLYLFCGIAALAAAGICVSTSIPQARAVAFCFGIGFSAINAIDWAFALSLVPPGEEARYLSMFQTCFYLPQVAVLGAGGLIGQHFGYRALFWTIPFWFISGMLMLRRVREPMRSNSPQETRQTEALDR